MDDGASLSELKRRAYSSDDADAIAARQRLAVIEQESNGDAVAGVAPSVDAVPHTAAPRWLVGALALCVAAVGTSAVVATSTPLSSLDVFSRAQNAQDLTIPSGIGASRGTERWLGDYGGSRVFTFYSPSGEVCLVAVESDTVAGNCVPREEFLESGIELNTGLLTSTGTEYFSTVWGPDGPPRFVDGVRAPADEP